ncbi:MAG: DUF2191 domain-containing protein [Nitrospiraceae bacterium]
MGSHMKTTVEIPDSLLNEAKRLAAKEHTTVRALIEQGLRRVLADRRRHTPFRLRKVTFKGQGLHPDVAGKGWARVRELAYEGHGG